MPLRDRLLALYAEIVRDLNNGAPGLMDFFAHSPQADPQPFIKHFGSWLHTRAAFGDLKEAEQALRDTPAEAFLAYLENDLSPTKSYKMVVLKCLLQFPGPAVQWAVSDIAQAFLKYYLDHRERLRDYEALARHSNPELFSLKQVEAHLMNMPLKFLGNKANDWFILDRQQKVFAVKPELVPQWHVADFRAAVYDRVEYALARYFNRP